MRTLLSRGKRIDNGEWVHGYYVHLTDDKGKEQHRIYTGYAESDCGEWYPDWWEVDPATIGRYTGLTDKHGKEIFEGDIVSAHFDALFPDDETLMEIGHNGLVFTERGKGRCPTPMAEVRSLYEEESKELWDVIGNIYDTPDLMEGK